MANIEDYGDPPLGWSDTSEDSTYYDLDGPQKYNVSENQPEYDSCDELDEAYDVDSEAEPYEQYDEFFAETRFKERLFERLFTETKGISCSDTSLLYRLSLGITSKVVDHAKEVAETGFVCRCRLCCGESFFGTSTGATMLLDANDIAYERFYRKVHPFLESVKTIGLENVLLLTILDCAPLPWAAVQSHLLEQLPFECTVKVLLRHLYRQPCHSQCSGEASSKHGIGCGIISGFPEYYQYVEDGWLSDVLLWLIVAGATPKDLWRLLNAPCGELRSRAAAFLCRMAPETHGLREHISLQMIYREDNVTIRRAMIEVYGYSRFMIDAKAKVKHRDKYGVLYHFAFEDDEPLAMIKLRNRTPEPDGTFRVYFLRVPPTMTTARQAVAWTFGMRSKEYAPTQET